MSAFGPSGGRSPRPLLTLPRGSVIARFDSYLAAQRAVDFLSDEKFDVRNVSIIGTDLRMVERVTGRLTYGRVALAGAGSGAWFGLFVGLLLSLFGSEDNGFTVIGALILGAGFGIVLSVISYGLTRGRRDFTSMSQIIAAEYHVLCAPDAANDATAVLHRLPGGLGDGPGGPPPGGPGAPATVTPAPAAPVGVPAETGPPPPNASDRTQPTGPTYGEMIDRKRREEREAAERATRQGE